MVIVRLSAGFPSYDSGQGFSATTLLKQIRYYCVLRMLGVNIAVFRSELFDYCTSPYEYGITFADLSFIRNTLKVDRLTHCWILQEVYSEHYLDNETGNT